MNYEMITIKDNVTNRFSEPKLFINTADGQRWFKAMCNESPFGKDLSLYKVGDYNIVTGEIVPCSQFIMSGGDVIE